MSNIELYSKLDLQLMNVKRLRELLRKNKLKVQRLKADMVNSLLENKLGKDELIHKNDTSKFEDLPNELIYQICQNIDSHSLTNLVQSSSKIHSICNKILIGRYLESLLEGKTDLTEGLKYLDLSGYKINPADLRKLIKYIENKYSDVSNFELNMVNIYLRSFDNPNLDDFFQFMKFTPRIEQAQEFLNRLGNLSSQEKELINREISYEYPDIKYDTINNTITSY